MINPCGKPLGGSWGFFMSDRRCLCFFEALDGIRSDGGDVAERQIEVSSFSEADISVSLHAEQCGHPHLGRRTMGFDMRRLGFDPSVWRAFFHTRLWRGVLPAMALAFTVIFLFYCVVGGRRKVPSCAERW